MSVIQGDERGTCNHASTYDQNAPREAYGARALGPQSAHSSPQDEGRTGIYDSQEKSEVREMRDADTVLGIIHERSKQGLPLEDIYRQLYNPHLYLLAYDRLRNNKGALTPGVTGETVDGMKLSKIQRLIEALRFERHRWH